MTYRPSAFFDDPEGCLRGLRREVRRTLSEILSGGEVALGPGDFSFKFLPADHPLDDMTHDIHILMFAPASSGGVETADGLAGQLCNAIGKYLRGHMEQAGWTVTLRFSVAIHLSQTGSKDDAFSYIDLASLPDSGAQSEANERLLAARHDAHMAGDPDPHNF